MIDACAHCAADSLPQFQTFLLLIPSTAGEMHQTLNVILPQHCCNPCFRHYTWTALRKALELLLLDKGCYVLAALVTPHLQAIVVMLITAGILTPFDKDSRET